MARAFVVGMLFLIPWAAQAQSQLLELQPGVRVRVSAPPLLGGRLDATVAARRGDTLSLIRTGSAPIDVPIATLSAAEVFRGKDRGAGALNGAKWGAIVGLGLGGAIALGSNSENCLYEVCEPGNTSSDAAIVAVMALGGSLWGAGIGALVGRDRWERLHVPGARVSLSLDRLPGARLGVRVTF